MVSSLQSLSQAKTVAIVAKSSNIESGKDSIIGTDAFPLFEEITEYFRENAIRVDSDIYRLMTALESRLAREAISQTCNFNNSVTVYRNP